MALEEVAIVCFSFVSCIALAAGAYYLSEIKKEQQRQYGITQRAQMKMGTEAVSTSAYTGGEWWQPLAVELLKNPQIQQLILNKVAPSLVQGQTQE